MGLLKCCYKMAYTITPILTLFYITSFQITDCAYVSTDTKYGTLLGLSKKLPDGRPYDVYLGVPFASAPVGYLRWEKPIPPHKVAIRTAEEYAPYCKQLITKLYGFI